MASRREKEQLPLLKVFAELAIFLLACACVWTDKLQ
jgi:hypothetical protein